MRSRAERNGKRFIKGRGEARGKGSYAVLPQGSELISQGWIEKRSGAN